MNKFRSHNCGELSLKNDGKIVHLSGWVNKKRDHGGLLFIDLRDHYGLTQCVFDSNIKNFGIIESLKLESVLKIIGKVVKRSEETINENLPTGEIEILVEEFIVLNNSDQIPFQISVDDDASEEQRLKFRYLDLRRNKIHKNIILRSNVINRIREKMLSRNFLEIQTPILTASSPEGARDFLVPSRLNQGKFYALPQAPQIFKQLLMVSNFDKYFQIAPCFRDEDARADRSPGEFYQLDFEMAFVEQEDVLSEIEPVICEIFKEFSDKKVSNLPFKRITYKDSIKNYGTDKPDLRNPLLINDLTDCFVSSGFKIFEENIKKGMVVKGIKAPRSAEMPRAWFDKLNTWARNYGQKGLGYIICLNEDFKGPIASNIKKENLNKLVKRVGLESGDSVFFISDKKEDANKFASVVRTELCNQLKLLEKNSFQFCWIVDYPMFEINQTTNKIDFSHNLFLCHRVEWILC